MMHDVRSNHAAGRAGSPLPAAAPWPKVKLGELYEVHNGLSKPKDAFGSGWPFLSYSVVFNNFFLPESLDSLVQTSEKEQESYSIKYGDVFITRTSETSDELGMSCVALKDYPHATYNGFCKRLRPITERVHPRYIGYYLRTPEFRGRFDGLGASMITRASLRNEDLLSMTVSLPPLPIQQRIASVLGAYDDLIENNRRRIALLEKMARELYRERFVRRGVKGKVMSLGAIVSFKRGVGYGSKDIKGGSNVLLSMNNIRPFGGFIRDYSRKFSGRYSEDQKVHEGDLIMAITDMTQDRRIIGYTAIVPPGDDNRIICTHLMKVTSNECHPFFLNAFFNQSMSRIISEHATGATVLGLTADVLKEIKCCLPAEEDQAAYVEQVAPIINLIFNLENENENLSRQRDRLLPRLMSGKLEV